MRFKMIFISFLPLTGGVLSGCIMTKNPQYQSGISYMDARYEQIMYLNNKKSLSMSDYDDAYLIGTMFQDKKKYIEAKNLLKISFDAKHTLPAGVAYINVLKALGESQEAEHVHDVLTMLYAENEIQTQTKISEYH